MVDEIKKTEAEVLFPEIEVEGFKIRPWTWNQLISVLPIVSEMIEKIQQSGFEIKELDPSDPKILLRFISLIGPHAPDVVEKTLEIDRSELDKWESGKLMNVFIVIIVQNASRLKNSLSLGIGQVIPLLTSLGPLQKL